MVRGGCYDDSDSLDGLDALIHRASGNETAVAFGDAAEFLIVLS